MTRIRGNQIVDPGVYFNLRHFSFRSMEEEGRLPGDENDVYHRVPALALLVVGPVLGLVYVMFLPFIGIAMVSWLLARKAADLAAEATVSFTRVLRPSWVPTTAFLARTKAAKRARRQKEPQRDAWAEDAKQRLDDQDRDGA
ncbi:MAG: hypothetical protein JSV80_14485 [Acidobacteriota bacterium]|nr:MAG: hypothetical protein JSV80_14485 [Acidobacteriota bacterium]